MTTQTLPATNGGAQQQPASPINTLRGLLERSKGQIALALPRHLDADRMIRVAVTACQRTPGLLDCSPVTIVGCVIQAAELGLELSGPLGHCYMIPRKNRKAGGIEAVFQVGYRGLIDLAMRSGKVDSMPLRVVYTNDHFRYGYGTNQFIEHIPAEEGPPEIQDPKLPYPDNVRAVYAVLNLKGSDRPDFEVMSLGQIEAHRRRYSPDSYKGSFSPWLTAWEEMAKKTPARRLAKRAPLSVEFQRAAILDEYGEAGVPQALAPATLDLGDRPQSRTEALANRLGAQRPASTQQVVEIHTLSEHAPTGWLAERLAFHQVETAGELSAEAAAEVIRDLRQLEAEAGAAREIGDEPAEEGA